NYSLTGATSGIGYHLAQLFAKDRYNLVLVARTEQDLLNVKDELRYKFSAAVKIIPKDLSKIGAAQEIFNETQQQGILVDVLVNDAGIGDVGFFWDIPFEKDLEMIQLNIIALVHLTKLYLSEMLQRNEGKILQLGSVVSSVPAPLQAVYSATKAFVSNFTDALINELKDSKVTMTLLSPGQTQTDFFNKAHASDTKIAQPDSTDDPEKVAERGYKALMKGQHHEYGSTMRKIQVGVSHILPNELTTAQLRSDMKKVDK
ncbi:unnamed protein product, partial [Didymodactylos carnosus]